MLAAFPWGRYNELIAKRQSESLALDEHAELVALSDQVEAASEQRLALLSELAELRRTSLPSLMTELGLRPHE